MTVNSAVTEVSSIAARLRPGRSWLPFVALALVALAIPFVFDRPVIRTLNVVLLMALAAQGLAIVMGFGGLVSVATAALLGVGGFLTGFLYEQIGIGLVPATLVAALGGTTIGLVLALPGLRLKHLYFATATFSIHFIIIFALQTIQIKWHGGSPFSLGIPAIGPIQLRTPVAWYVVLGLLTACMIAIAQVIKISSLGRALKAIRDDEDAAEIAGIDTVRAKIVAFAISSGAIAATGAIRAYYQQTVSYEDMTLGLAIQCLAIVVVGGMSYSYGPLLGAVLVVGLPEFIAKGLQGVVSAAVGSQIFLIRDMLFGVLVIYFMTIGPDGAPGALRAWRKGLARAIPSWSR